MMSESPKYLFLGGLFPHETEKQILENSIGSIQNAANAFQWNLIHGFDQTLDKPIKILNSLYVGSYPKRYRNLFIKSYEFHHTEGADDLNVGFCNLTGYKNISRRRTLGKQVEKWVKDNKGPKYIFAYAMTSTMINALNIAKKIDPDAITCLIVPDLPQYMNMGKRSPIFKLLKKFDMKDQRTKFAGIDAFVFLTKQMNNYIGTKNFLVIEGIANDLFKELTPLPRFEKTVLYTGGLNEKYGVKNLIDAFTQIEDSEYKLILCGSGDLEPYINELKKIDGRIDFRGTVQHDEILSLQMQATVLVNPRQNIEAFTQYSFPSKNLEYLASGTPVVAYKLDGIPDEYDDYFVYVNDNSVEALKNKIVEVCSLPVFEREMIGEKAHNFVLNEKSSKKQVEKLLDFVHSI